MMSAPSLTSPAATRGFTLVELLVTLAIFGILTALALPSFQTVMLGPRLSGYANSFTAAATLARSEAIKRNAQVSLCASADGASCATSGGWEQGWIVLSGTTVLQRQQSLPTAYRGTDTIAGSTSLNFLPTGAGSSQATVRFCQAVPSAGNQEKLVTVSATGRSYVSTTRSGVCP
jgi:type IV fimbrial biogenesis protein FimT